MNVDDMIILSIDDHTVEPPDMFDGTPAGEVPGPARRSCVRDENGFDHWVFEGKDVATVGLNATVSLAEGGVGHAIPAHSPRCAPAPT